MELGVSFLIGLLGSLHCAGMCGPLALALPAAGGTHASYLTGRLAYNLGRILTYSALGALFGLLGQTLVLAGLQRWLSLIAGVTVLLGLLASSRWALPRPAVRGVTWLKSRLGSVLRQRGWSSQLFLGLLNGLLPCGLVYFACATAAATGRALPGAVSMLAFGLGTLPMMLALSLAARPLRIATRHKLQALLSPGLALVALLLILRGLALGIPGLSPDHSAGAITCHAIP